MPLEDLSLVEQAEKLSEISSKYEGVRVSLPTYLESLQNTFPDSYPSANDLPALSIVNSSNLEDAVASINALSFSSADYVIPDTTVATSQRGGIESASHQLLSELNDFASLSEQDVSTATNGIEALTMTTVEFAEKIEGLEEQMLGGSPFSG